MTMSYQNFGYNTLKTVGTVADSNNFVFVAEGFVASEMSVFNAKCTELINYILATSPFKENAALFNFYSVPVISPQSGITHPFTCGAQCSGVIPAMPQKFVNSYFGISYDQEGLHRFLLPTNAQTINILNTIAASMPIYKLGAYNFEPIIIANDPNYGGSEGGSVATTTLNTQSNEVLMHELGHSIGATNDEYIGGSVSESWNTTQKVGTTSQATYSADLSVIRWKALVPSGAGGIQIGSENLYKGFAACKMNTLGVPYCLVCATQLAKSFGQLITLSGGTPTVPVVYPTVTPPPPPPPVNNSPITSVWLATGASDNPYIEVNNVAGASKYIYTITSAGLPTITGTSNNVYAAHLKAKTTYTVTVMAIINGVNSLPSNPFTFTTP